MEALTSVALGGERTELLPLNSRRLTAAMVRRLALALDIPTTGSAEDMRQLLDAKRGHKPMKVQVVVCTGADGVTLCLEDVEGTFFEVRPEKRGSPDEEGGARSEGDADESLQQSLQAARFRNQELTEELQSVWVDLEKAREELQAKKLRASQLWQVSCDRLAVFDAALHAKDQEIALLRQMLTEQSALQPVPATLPIPVSPNLLSPDTDIRVSTPAIPTLSKPRKGKTPPVELFIEDPEVSLDDW